MQDVPSERGGLVNEDVVPPNGLPLVVVDIQDEGEDVVAQRDVPLSSSGACRFCLEPCDEPLPCGCKTAFGHRECHARWMTVGFGARRPHHRCEICLVALAVGRRGGEEGADETLTDNCSDQRGDLWLRASVDEGAPAVGSTTDGRGDDAHAAEEDLEAGGMRRSGGAEEATTEGGSSIETLRENVERQLVAVKALTWFMRAVSGASCVGLALALYSAVA